MAIAALVKEGEMNLRQWTGRRRTASAATGHERLWGFVVVWVVPILVILALSFFAAAHP